MIVYTDLSLVERPWTRTTRRELIIQVSVVEGRYRAVHVLIFLLTTEKATFYVTLYCYYENRLEYSYYVVFFNSTVKE